MALDLSPCSGHLTDQDPLPVSEPLVYVRSLTLMFVGFPCIYMYYTCLPSLANLPHVYLIIWPARITWRVEESLFCSYTFHTQFLLRNLRNASILTGQMKLPLPAWLPHAGPEWKLSQAGTSETLPRNLELGQEQCLFEIWTWGRSKLWRIRLKGQQDL